MNRADYTNLYTKLAGTRTKYTECVKITRLDGQIYRFTAHDEDLLIQEEDSRFHSYKSADSFTLTALENQAGLVVSNMDVEAIVSDDSISEDDLIGGLFDHAKVELFIAYWAGQQIGTLPLRASWIGEITLKGVQFKADLRGIAQKLQQVFLKATSLECRWSFGDQFCGKNLTTFTKTVTITTVESNDTFVANILLADRNKFQWGLARWVTGNNAGGEMEIIRNFNQRIQLFLPMPFAISVGDQVQLVYGCDKVFKTCRATYDNSERFGGEPFLAGSDLLITYPRMLEKEDEEDEGGSKF